MKFRLRLAILIVNSVNEFHSRRFMELSRGTFLMHFVKLASVLV